MKRFLSVLLISLIAFNAQTVNAGFNSGLVVSHSGKILYSKNPTTRCYPASLTKLMTVYIVFQELKRKRINFDTKFVVSRHAASMPRSKIDVRAGTSITVKDALLSLIVKSANDVAVVVAEGIGGSEKKFATLMNVTAYRLGMHNTNFVNPSGLHHPKQYTTAEDMIRLARAIHRDFPEYYHLFARNSFYFRNKLYRSTNRVLKGLHGAEGMKTGYTSNAGWNIVTSARRNDVMLMGIILGGTTYYERDRHIINIMDQCFTRIKQSKVTATPPRSKSKKGLLTNASYEN